MLDLGKTILERKQHDEHDAKTLTAPKFRMSPFYFTLEVNFLFIFAQHIVNSTGLLGANKWSAYLGTSLTHIKKLKTLKIDGLAEVYAINELRIFNVIDIKYTL